MAKISEKAQAVMQRPDNGGPDYLVRARQEKNSRYFSTIGAAWLKQDRNGNEMISLKLSSVPLNWDGSCLLVKPFVSEGDTQE